MSNEIFTTSDGSHSLISGQFDVPYHSKHGAIQESNHVFIATGLIPKLAEHKISNLNDISILEVGLGTGLNVLLTAMHLAGQAINCYYKSLEKYPVSDALLDSLNYTTELGKGSGGLWEKLHRSSWGQEVSLAERFRFQKAQIDFLKFDEQERYDLVYFDAFAPNAQPELWTTSALAIFINALKPGGVLTTYCAKGQVRRNFISLGCTVKRMPGPPGKREMLHITKA